MVDVGVLREDKGGRGTLCGVLSTAEMWTCRLPLQEL